MRFLLTLVLCVSAFAGGGNSLISSTTYRNSGSIPNTATYSSVSTFCLEGQVDGVTFPASTNAGIYGMGWNTTVYPVQVLTDSSSNLIAFGPNNSEGATVTLTGWTAFRWQFSRSGSTYTLKAWNEATGSTKSATGSVATGGAWDWRNADFHFGSARAAFDSIIGNIGFVRLELGSDCDFTQPPQRKKTSGYANGADWELENNLTDSSVNSIPAPTYSVGSAAYQATQNLGPVAVTGTIARSAKTGTATPMQTCSSFGNQDTNTVTVAWTQTSGPTGTFTNSTNCSTATFAPGGFGTAALNVAVTDTAAVTSNVAVSIGGYIADSQGRVDVLTESGSATIANIIGPLIATESNPWAWKANRDYYEADLWTSRLSTYFPRYWAGSPATGTVAVVSGGTTLTFSGVNAQNTFCGGGTSPLTATKVVVVRYSSPQVSGQTGNAAYEVSACPTSSTVTISAGADGWWQTASTSGLNYTVASYDDWSQFVFSGIPANYYDNVLAFYSLYYATGIDTYRDSARDLAKRFFEGPNWDLGYNYASVGGNYHPVAGPARGQAVTGLILWVEEQGSGSIGYNPWDGIKALWGYWGFAVEFTRAASQGIGDARETGYMTAGLALCARYEPNAGVKAQCVTDLNNAVDNLWIAYETTAPGGGGHWVQPSLNGGTGDQLFAGSGVSVTVQDGDATVTVTGATIPADFGDNCYGVSASKNCWIWFLFDPNDTSLGGNSTAAIGETVAYKVASYTDSTHFELATNHNSGLCSSPCTYGMYKGSTPGLGMLPYMLGMAMGGLGTYTYDYYVSAGDTTRANSVKAMVQDGMNWVATTGYETANHRLWYSVDYIQCSATGAANQPCDGDVSLNGEAMRGFCADYLLNSDATVLTKGDDLYHYQWGKPGYSAPYTPDTYLDALNDNGYMNTAGAIYNKWFGFFFGYGFGQCWPAARLGSGAAVTTKSLGGGITLGGGVTF